MHLPFLTRHLQARRAGLSRAEWIWTVLLVGVILTTILVTLDAEVERGQERMDRDQLAYLASSIHLGLEQQGIHGPKELPSPLPLLGPGTPPLGEDGKALEANSLTALMPPGFPLPTDPWGRAYVLVSNGPAALPNLYVLSAGADGRLPEQLDPTLDEVAQVFWRIDT